MEYVPSSQGFDQNLQPRPIAYRPSVAAHLLGISLSHLERMTKAGQIPYARIGSLKVYSDEVLRNWIREKTDEVSGRDGRE